MDEATLWKTDGDASFKRKWNRNDLSFSYKDLKEVCQRADILVAAIGKPKFFDESYVKDGAVVIDVGIHRNAENKLCGDVDYDKVADKVSAITPVPGGVGPMTIAMLMNNCVEAALRMNNR